MGTAPPFIVAGSKSLGLYPVVQADGSITWAAGPPAAHAASHRTAGTDRLIASDIGSSPAYGTDGAATTVPFNACDGGQAPTAGVLYVSRVTLLGGRQYTTAKLLNGGTAGVTLASSFLSLYRTSDLTRVANSADLSAALAAVVANGLYTLTPFTYTPSATEGFYVGLLIGSAVTMPTLLRRTAISANQINNAPKPWCHRHNTTGLTASPDPLVLMASPSAFIQFAIELS